EPGHAHVHADLAAGCGQRAGRHIVTGEDYVPAAAFSLEGDRLDPPLPRAMLVDPHVADTLKVDTAHVGLPAAPGSRVYAELVRPPHRPRSLRQGCSYWVSMYRCTVAADTAPTVAAKYDFDHRVGSRDLRCGNSSRSTRDVYPLNWFATCAGESAGLVLTNRCTWSGMTSHATTRHPFAAAF